MKTINLTTTNIRILTNMIAMFAGTRDYHVYNHAGKRLQRQCNVYSWHGNGKTYLIGFEPIFGLVDAIWVEND